MGNEAHRTLLSEHVGMVPDFVSRLMWDVDPATVDLDTHADYVIERVMSRGGWDAMRWIRKQYDSERLRDFLTRKGERLAGRELAYWSLIAGLDVPIRAGAGRPPWAGP